MRRVKPCPSPRAAWRAPVQHRQRVLGRGAGRQRAQLAHVEHLLADQHAVVDQLGVEAVLRHAQGLGQALGALALVVLDAQGKGCLLIMASGGGGSMRQAAQQLPGCGDGDLREAQLTPGKVSQVVRDQGAGPGGNRDFQHEVVALVAQIGAPEVAHMHLLGTCHEVRQHQLGVGPGKAGIGQRGGSAQHIAVFVHQLLVHHERQLTLQGAAHQGVAGTWLERKAATSTLVSSRYRMDR